MKPRTNLLDYIDTNQPLSDYIEFSIEEMITRSAAVYTSLKRRHSIRQFSDRDVPKTVIENCLKAAGTGAPGITLLAER